VYKTKPRKESRGSSLSNPGRKCTN